MNKNTTITRYNSRLTISHNTMIQNKLSRTFYKKKSSIRIIPIVKTKNAHNHKDFISYICGPLGE